MKISSVRVHGIKSFRDCFVNFEDYTAFIGENNSGKSNLLFALLWFFGKVKMDSQDLNNEIEEDPYVEVEFKLSAGEEFSHPSEYLVNNIFKVRAIASKSEIQQKSTSCSYYGYTGNEEDSIKNTKLLGWKTVAKASFGDVVYIPSVRNLSDELKLTASSALNQLITKNVIARIKDEDPKQGKYQRVVQSINELSDFISTGEDSALEKLKKDVSDRMLDYKGVTLGFKLDPPNVEELVKNCFKPLTRNHNNAELPISSQGDGFQRSLIFSLIANLAEINKESGKRLQSSIKNDCTFYFIEEPELFLHPNHQTYFRNKLSELSNFSGSQVVVTSHSPYFINNISKYSQIKKVSLNEGESSISQISDKEVSDICLENAKVMAKAKSACKPGGYSLAEMEAEIIKISHDDHIRYLLWVDPTRANAFLSKKVILVEGSTEKAFFSFIFNNLKGIFFDNKEVSNIHIVDTNGKYHFYKFAKLLTKFGVKCWCIYDKDDSQCVNGVSHGVLNSEIESLKEQGILIDTLQINPDLEGSLGVIKDRKKPDIEMYANLVNNTNNCLGSEGYKSIADFVRKVIVS